MKSKILTVVLLFALFCGCKDESPQKTSLVVIDGNSITDSDLCDRVEIMLTVRDLSGKKTKAKDLPSLANGLGHRILPSLVANALLEKFLVRNPVSIDQSVENRILAQYRRMFKMRDASVDDICARFGSLSNLFRRQLEFEFRLNTATDKYVESNLSKKQVAEHMRRSNASRRNILTFNKQAAQNAEKLWKQLSNGAKWDELAEEYSEDKQVYGENCQFAREWDTVNTNCQFYIREVGEAVKNLQIGQVAKPIEAEEGFIIVKVVAKNEEKITCARILLRTFVPPDELTTDTARESLRAKCRAEFKSKTIAEEMKVTRIEYPLGTNVTYKVWPMLSKRKRFIDAGH